MPRGGQVRVTFKSQVFISPPVAKNQSWRCLKSDFMGVLLWISPAWKLENSGTCESPVFSEFSNLQWIYLP